MEALQERAREHSLFSQDAFNVSAQEVYGYDDYSEAIFRDQRPLLYFWCALIGMQEAGNRKNRKKGFTS